MVPRFIVTSCVRATWGCGIMVSFLLVNKNHYAQIIETFLGNMLDLMRQHKGRNGN